MEELILFSYLNDFIFCPISIYFHKLYGNRERLLYQEKAQLDGIHAHKTIDTKTFRTSNKILQGIDVYCSTYNLLGKIDIYDMEKQILTERKNRITKIYDGYVFQLYAQYYSLIDMGYIPKQIRFYSIVDNKVHWIKLPNEDKEMLNKFQQLISDINTFDMESFTQENVQKCANCIYEPSCDRSLLCC